MENSGYTHFVCLMNIRIHSVDVNTIMRTCNCHLYTRTFPAYLKTRSFPVQTWEVVWSHRGIGQLGQHVHSSRTNQVEG